MRTLLFSLLTWLWACAGLFAQNTAPLSRQAAKTDCQNRLEQAENAIQRGEIFFALAKIEDCALHARERFSPEDGLRALRLLIILYEETRQTEKAEKAMQMLLHQYPRFKPASSVDRYQLI